MATENLYVPFVMRTSEYNSEAGEARLKTLSKDELMRFLGTCTKLRGSTAAEEKDRVELIARLNRLISAA